MATSTRQCILFALIFSLGIIVAIPRPVNAASCGFVLGFGALDRMIPNQVGGCLTDERYNPANGDSLQQTTDGLMVWRKADNWTAFTDGYHTWINGPKGLQERLNSDRFPWEADYATFRNPTPVPAAVPRTMPTPVVVYNYYVETSTVLGSVRPGGSQTFCARLSAPNAPPVAGLTAKLTIDGHDYFATTQAPDGNACVTAPVPLNAISCYFNATITYQGREIAEPGWAHHENCQILPF